MKYLVLAMFDVEDGPISYSQEIDLGFDSPEDHTGKIVDELVHAAGAG